MRTVISIVTLIYFSVTLSAQELNIHKTDGSVVKIALSNIDSISFINATRSIDEFYLAKPNDWSCEIFQTSFDTLPIPQGNKGKLENPLAVIRYYNNSIPCSKANSLYLQVYDISKKDTLEKIIAASMIYSWCIPFYVGENESFYIITSPCWVSNGCWTDKNLEPLYLALKGLFTKSIFN